MQKLMSRAIPTTTNVNNFVTMSASTKQRLLYLSAFSGLLGLKYEYERQAAVSTMNLKKERMAMPVYELKGEEAVSFPWNSENIDEWMYRPVKITGRKIHRQVAYIFNRENAPGFDMIMPVVTREPESADFDKREGIMVNIGWIPAVFKHKHFQTYYPDAENEYSFVGVLTPQDNLKNDIFSKGRNSWSEQHFEINELDLGDMARASEFLNQKKMKHALIECVNMNTPLDEQSADLYDKDLSHSRLYPYVRTRAGILNQGPTPWDIARKEKFWFGLGSISGLFALAAKVI